MVVRTRYVSTLSWQVCYWPGGYAALADMLPWQICGPGSCVVVQCCCRSTSYHAAMRCTNLHLGMSQLLQFRCASSGSHGQLCMHGWLVSVTSTQPAGILGVANFVLQFQPTPATGAAFGVYRGDTGRLDDKQVPLDRWLCFPGSAYCMCVWCCVCCWFGIVLDGTPVPMPLCSVFMSSFVDFQYSALWLQRRVVSLVMRSVRSLLCVLLGVCSLEGCSTPSASSM
jgi:hypothetical protein